MPRSLLVVGIFRQVTGSISKPLEDTRTLLRFHEDERRQRLLNCRALWHSQARDPLVVVSELLQKLLDLVQRRGALSLKESEEFVHFAEAAGELQMVDTSKLTRIDLLVFFVNTYNLMALHFHITQGTHGKVLKQDQHARAHT